MAFSRKHLNEGEDLVLDLHPHWIFLVPSLASLLAIIVVGIVVLVGTHGTVQNVFGPLAGIVVLVTLVWFGVRLAQWKTTEFAVTNYRVMSMSGILSKRGIQIPLDRINTVEYERKLLERMVGAGDLLIESASDDGRQRFENIRHPDDVQREINMQIRHNSGRDADIQRQYQQAAAAATAAAAPAESVADQLTKLDELRRNGVLSEAEFQAQKARLLQG